MSELIQMQEQVRDLLDDCVAMVEALRCLRDKGAEGIDAEGVTLTEAVFDRCFPGVEWEPITVKDKPIGLEIKQAEYREIIFDTVREDAV